MIPVAVDTSVVVASLLAWHDAHQASLAALAASSGRGFRLLLPRTVLVQSWSVMTRLPPGRRLAPDIALEILRSSFEGKADVIDPPSGEGWTLLAAAAAAGAVGGGLHDFEILDTAARAGARRLLTLNTRDFLRFGDRGVAIVGP